MTGPDPVPLPQAIPRGDLLDRIPPPGAVSLVAVTAPAGFGKSTLLAQWAAAGEGAAVAWADLSVRDDEALVAGRLALQLSTQRSRQGREPSFVEIVNLVADLDTPVAVVLDDLHLASTDLQAAVHSLVRRAPAGLTIAVASRRALPFPTGRLLAYGESLQLGPSDLVFTFDEVRRAFERSTGHAPTDEQWGVLHGTTGGWPPAVVLLAALTHANRADSPESVAALDELDHAVLADLPADAARLVVDTAELDPLEPDAVAAVADQPDAHRVLEDLARHHLLLAEAAVGYRRHPGIEQLLRRRFARGDVPHRGRLHRRAAQWYRSRRAPTLALDHAARAGDLMLDAASIGSAVGRALHRGQGDLLRRWASALPFPADLGPRDSSLVTMATALLTPGERGRWSPPPSTEHVHPAVEATVESMTLVREGRCGDARAAAQRARTSLRNVAADALVASVAEALLDIVVTDCRILTSAPNGEDPDLPRHLQRSPWPWLYFRGLAQRSLHAYIGGRPAVARALLALAKRHRGAVDPSWILLGNGALPLTEALVASDAAQVPHERDQAIDEAAAVLRRAERAHDVPVALLARYALHRAYRRSGASRPAADQLTRADAVLATHPDLAFVHEARRALLGHASPALAEAAIEQLTTGERAVFGQLASPLTFGEIARALHLSHHTIKGHTRSIYRKLGVTSRAQAVRLLKDV